MSSMSKKSSVAGGTDEVEAENAEAPADDKL